MKLIAIATAVIPFFASFAWGWEGMSSPDMRRIRREARFVHVRDIRSPLLRQQACLVQERQELGGGLCKGRQSISSSLQRELLTSGISGSSVHGSGQCLYW
ncbi:hypothetical protein EJ03DRAFT_327548 [Teratosphaeria nubilosa]|uniref:Uncharacterized protein n=1 Tax=Teratosphaeria nubilosa TaxID=161662 RepID=A0A6G1L8V8_9PEZI|nr:hypothetical protein EJ03DRAFT_327548 [Teratosphaeria nubilosa]